MSDETPEPPRNRGGRPKIARGLATTSPEADSPWTIRGVPRNVRAIASRAATARNATVGDWVGEAVVRHARGVLGDVDGGLYDETEVKSDGKALAAIAPPADAAAAREERLIRALERQAREARMSRWARRRR